MLRVTSRAHTYSLLVLASVIPLCSSIAVITDLLSDDYMSFPTDVKFRPGTNDLWVANRDTDSVTVFQLGPDGEAEPMRMIQDVYASHYMDQVIALNFNRNGKKFASCQDSNNNYNDMSNPGNGFMGPTLWRTKTFGVANQAKVPGGKLGSHIDMLHESPHCGGIVWTRKNQYWAWDGSDATYPLVRYDFLKDHGEGGNDHSTGAVVRFGGVSLRRLAGVPGHMAYYKPTNTLFISDTGGGTVVKVDLDTVLEGAPVPSSKWVERLVSYKYGTVSSSVIATGLDRPTGLALDANKCLLYVGTMGGKIHAIETSATSHTTKTLDTDVTKTLHTDVTKTLDTDVTKTLDTDVTGITAVELSKDGTRLFMVTANGQLRVLRAPSSYLLNPSCDATSTPSPIAPITTATARTALAAITAPAAPTSSASQAPSVFVWDATGVTGVSLSQQVQQQRQQQQQQENQQQPQQQQQQQQQQWFGSNPANPSNPNSPTNPTNPQFPFRSVVSRTPTGYQFNGGYQGY